MNSNVTRQPREGVKSPSVRRGGRGRVWGALRFAAWAACLWALTLSFFYTLVMDVPRPLAPAVCFFLMAFAFDRMTRSLD